MTLGIELLATAALLIPAIQSRTPVPAPPILAEPGVYLIGAGDILSITVAEEPDLSGAYEVQPDGTIRFPMIGETQVSGIKPGDAARKSERLL